MVRLRTIATVAFMLPLLQACGALLSQKDDTASVLNPRKIHSAFDPQSQAFKAGQIPVQDYYSALELARSKYDTSASGIVMSVSAADSALVENYVSEGIGLVDAYCSRWFQGLDDTSRLLAYQNKNINVITQLGTALLGIGGASAAFVTGYGASTTAYAGITENFNSAFLVAPTAAKVKEHIVSVMSTQADQLRRDAPDLNFKQAYSRLERYADLCTHSRAKAIVDSALDLTRTQIGAGQQVETVSKK